MRHGWTKLILAASAGWCIAGLGAPDAQTSAHESLQTDFAALTAISAALSPADKARANGLFSTAFGLWKSGDFAAAEIGFKRGLDIDPANASANFYYGDCLARRKAKGEARPYLERATRFGENTTEGLKAQAELTDLSAKHSDVSQMDEDEIAASLAGQWDTTISCSWGVGHYKTDIEKIVGGDIGFVSSLGFGQSFKSGRIRESLVTINYSRLVMSGRLIAADHIEGTVTQSGGICRWTADKLALTSPRTPGLVPGAH